MITRFDHAVIAVPNVDDAIDAYSALGFDVAAGGRHPSIGTQNAIVRFGLDYLELLAVEDFAQARASGPFGAELAEFLEQGGGLVGFVLASSDLDQQSTGLSAIDQAHAGPFAMDRERPDGRRLAWRLVIPGNSPWRKTWPFLIEWETPDGDRLSWDSPGDHSNGECGVAGIELIVENIEAAKQFYEQGLGLRAVAHAPRSATYVLGQFTLYVSEPADVLQRDELKSRGPGPFRLLLESRVGTPTQGDLDIDAALGARIRIVTT